MSEFNFLLARRSIYDAKMKVLGYYLFFQDPHVRDTDPDSIPEQLTCKDIQHLFHDEQFKIVLGVGQVFINFSESMLTELASQNFHFPLNRLVVVFDEKQIQLTPEKVQLINRLFFEKYQLCLSGYLNHPDLKHLLDHIHYYKINTHSSSLEDIKKTCADLTAGKDRLGFKFFFEQIGTHELFEATKEMGNHLFEGRFLNLPNLVKTDTVATNRIAAMKLLLALDNPDISLKEVEDILSQDSRMSYKLLRLINSAAYGLPRVVNSIREAVVFLGLQQIRSWTSLAVISSVEEKPKDLLLTTMIRAKMSELIADVIGAEDPTSFFTVGLFSTLDALLDKTMQQVLDDIAISNQVKEALLNRSGEMGEVLSVIIAYECGDWDVIKECGLAPKQLSDIYLQSVTWASNSFKELQG